MVVGFALCRRTHCGSKCSLFTTMVTSDSDSGSGQYSSWSSNIRSRRLMSDCGQIWSDTILWPTSSSSSSGSAPAAALASSMGLCRICRRYVEVIGKLRSMSRLLSSLARFSAVTGRMVTPLLPELEAGSGVPWWHEPAAISSPAPEPRLPRDTEPTPEPRPECPPHLEAVIIRMLGHEGKLVWSILDQTFSQSIGWCRTWRGLVVAAAALASGWRPECSPPRPPPRCWPRSGSGVWRGAWQAGACKTGGRLREKNEWRYQGFFKSSKN